MKFFLRRHPRIGMYKARKRNNNGQTLEGIEKLIHIRRWNICILMRELRILSKELSPSWRKLGEVKSSQWYEKELEIEEFFRRTRFNNRASDFHYSKFNEFLLFFLCYRWVSNARSIAEWDFSRTIFQVQGEIGLDRTIFPLNRAYVKKTVRMRQDKCLTRYIFGTSNPTNLITRISSPSWWLFSINKT